jgi:hypothetical protein
MLYTVKSAFRVLFASSCLLFMVSWTAFGQDPEPPHIPDFIGEGDFSIIAEANQPLQDELNMSDLNRIALQQIGDMNQSFILQYSKNEPNLAKVLQYGDENISKLVQKGDNNATDIYQHGYGNFFSGIHKGDNILNTIVQEGNGNNIEQYLNADVLDFKIEQFKDGNELFQYHGDGEGGIGYKVTQTGGMSITIIQGNINK